MCYHSFFSLLLAVILVHMLCSIAVISQCYTYWLCSICTVAIIMCSMLHVTGYKEGLYSDCIVVVCVLWLLARMLYTCVSLLTGYTVYLYIITVRMCST